MNTNEVTKPIPLSTKGKQFISSALISTITISSKKAHKRAKKIIGELKNTLEYCIDATEDSTEKALYLKTIETLPRAREFVEETCQGFRFPGSWLDFDENGKGKYSAMFGIVVGKDENNRLVIEIGCKIAVTESPSESTHKLPFFCQNYEQKYLV